jgi:hypothetical protein
MAELTEQQIELISAYIRQHGVASDSLHADLLDHVCTSIEHLMDDGQTFEEAFAQTIKLFGPGGLKQVQQLTFELLTEMNVTMKKVAFSFGLTSAILLLAGTIFKLMHWPMAAILIVLGTAMLTLLYLPMLLWHKLKESGKDEYLLHISGFVGLTLTSVGVLFKIMHWPGAAVTLLSGMIVLGLVYTPIFFIKKYQTSTNRPITLSSGLVAMTCLILVFGMMSVNTSVQYDRSMALVNGELDKTSARISENEALYQKLGNHQQANNLHAAADQAFERVAEYKIHLIAESEGISPAQAADVQVYLLKSKNNFDIPTHILFAEESAYRVSDLTKMLIAYKEVLLGQYDPVLRDQMDALLPFDFDEQYAWKGEQLDWARWHFYQAPLTSVLAQLSKIQLDIRNAETQALLYHLSQPAASGPPSGS